MRDRVWRWLAIGLVVANVAYWFGWQGWQAWQWKQMVNGRLGQLETAVIRMHPEIARQETIP